MIKSYKDLIVWQKSIELSEKVYKLTKIFPKDETYGLISQMRRAAVPIPSNIAEGSHRNSKKEFIQFLYVAYASATELESQIIISKRLKMASEANFTEVDKLLDEVLRILNALTKKLKFFSTNH